MSSIDHVGAYSITHAKLQTAHRKSTAREAGGKKMRLDCTIIPAKREDTDNRLARSRGALILLLNVCTYVHFVYV